ncbi:hypothetical protein, partial [Mesorhizobium sp.]|uniref:hypothetical protein n=1 Tax=Mesorhizobium sp. TaxID=1871066 RepID=UPI002579C20E
MRGDIVKLHSYNIIVFSSLEWAQGRITPRRYPLRRVVAGVTGSTRETCERFAQAKITSGSSFHGNAEPLYLFVFA